MILHHTLINFMCFLCYISIFSDCYVLIYHTENSPSTQYYDCLYYTRSEIQNNIQDVKYCRQLNESQRLQRDFNRSCHNGGQLWTFEKLSLLNVSVSDVLKWSSSIEQTNHYSKYLSNDLLDIGDQYICNCTKPASFGKFCEYEFYDGRISISEAITQQFELRDSFNLSINDTYVGSQLHDNRPCYITWICYSGLMCLDWRYICDGKQQCTDGIDEDYCETLEFNECEDDEYRCSNGMCIAEEYWLDGDYDCMDWTDEIYVTDRSGDICFHVPSFVCDEHSCPYNQWSCGDGQCLSDESDRYEGTRMNIESFCKNMRDANYMCEAVTRYSKSWWTINDGYCLPYPLAYRTLRLDTKVANDQCSFSVKCALSHGLDQDCKCKNATTCSNLVNDSCAYPYVFYPALYPLVSAHLYMYYKRERDWTNKNPTGIQYRGRMKCMGYQLIIKDSIWYSFSNNFQSYDYRTSENLPCFSTDETLSIRDYSGSRYDVHCWNKSKTFNNRSYQVSFYCWTRCISKYRVRDGVMDCYSGEEFVTINNSCPQIQRHRLQCSSSELSCLLASALGDLGPDCLSGRDEYDSRDGKNLRGYIACEKRTDSRCNYLRNYIRISSLDNGGETIVANNSMLDDHSAIFIPFRSYCDSFFDTKSGSDESPPFCEEWACSSDEYQCLSGQCILQSWVCDNEWDCNDGSDEQLIFIMDSLSEHSSQFMNITKIKEQCYQIYRPDNTPFFDFCNISTEYPCFRTDTDDPFNLKVNRPCIDLRQIGDGETDCLSGLDERNRLTCPDLGMLGFHFQLEASFCFEYNSLCHNRYSWKPGFNMAYDTVCFHQERRFKNGTFSDCNHIKDAMCLNDICLKDARCNGKVECLHGEDEYRCILQDKSQYEYRMYKKQKQFVNLTLRNYPSLQRKSSYHSKDVNPSLSLALDDTNSSLDLTTSLEATNIYEMRDSKVKSIYEIIRELLPNGTITFKNHYLPFICNRGVAVQYYTGHTVCLCPPSFYGSQCQFYSDRITVVTHLDLTNYHSPLHQIAVIKVLTTFLFEDLIIDYYEFHVNPQLQNENNYIKQNIYFLYPRTEEFTQMKRNNRSGTQLYSVRFEAFNLHLSGKIEPIGIWEYPIYFDFLPVFRLSKILRFRSSALSLSDSSCGENGVYQETIHSHRSSYFCSCNSGYYGNDCKSYAEECRNYCSPESICKPKYRGSLTGNQHPLCLCPASTFGTTCYLKNDNCRENPCLHEGSCIVTYDWTDTNSYVCLCTDLFVGDHCQYPKGMVLIKFLLSSDSKLHTADIIATTVSFNDYEIPLLRFNIRHQQVYGTLPSQIELIYSHTFATDAPATAVMKVYSPNYRNEESRYYILYFQPSQKDINITVDLSSENHCPLVQTLWHLLQRNETIVGPKFNSTTAVFFYHRICQAKRNSNTTFTCFRDQNYLCICELDHHRAECFGYNRSTDQCSFCLSNGYCLKGELSKRADFLCLCPRCHHGQMCQYSTEIMSFTLDSLIVKDVQNNRKTSSGVYIFIATLAFLFGFFNNLCGFLTFIRPKPRKIGVGNYLLIVSIVNQCSLLVLLLKVIHIIFGSNGTLFYYESLNQYSCKIVSYLLSTFTRITYWLTSFVTMERVYMVLFPTSVTFKSPRLALVLSISIVFAVAGMHVHEVLHYTAIIDLSYTSVNITLCVVSYVQSSVSIYNRANVLVHYFIPFFIQVISITVIVIQTTCHRARTSGSRQQTFIDLFKKQFKKHKEHYVTPMIIVFSSLPQIILSFSYACTELKQLWQRYILITTYFLSYLPQMLGFILYVLPSTAYSDEFRQTVIGKILLRQQRPLTDKQLNIKMVTRPINQTATIAPPL